MGNKCETSFISSLQCAKYEYLKSTWYFRHSGISSKRKRPIKKADATGAVLIFGKEMMVSMITKTETTARGIWEKSRMKYLDKIKKNVYFRTPQRIAAAYVILPTRVQRNILVKMKDGPKMMDRRVRNVFTTTTAGCKKKTASQKWIQTWA